MAKPAKFAHVVYRTRRFHAMVDWYAKVFEATVQHKDPVLAFLTYDDEHHRFAFINLDELRPAAGGAPQPAETGVDHVAYTYASAGALLETYERLAGEGIRPYWPVHHGPTLSLYYKDPDGNRLEFQVDCFETAAEAKAYMSSAAFEANPIGVEIDPEVLLRRYRGGAREAELLGRPDGPRSPIPVAHGV